MQEHHGKALSWSTTSGRIELALHRKPCNEIGSELLAELEQFVAALAATDTSAHALIIYSEIPAGFSAGGDLRELYHRSQEVAPSRRVAELKQIGLVSQVAGEGEVLGVARATAAQLSKFDRRTVAAAKLFIKPIPEQHLREEIEIVCDLFMRPAVEAGLRKFVESTNAFPYLP